jgi:methylated-DNA-[protein]-cysteine S-methyltransferase
MLALSVESPIGTLRLASDGERLTRLSFGPAQDAASDASPLLLEAERQLQAYFRGELHRFDLPTAAAGTAFQLAVWAAVAEIPWGSLMSYQALAERVGGQAVARAVGGANGANPLPIIVPCHRVVGSSGALTGYAGGLQRKRWLLRHEGALAAELFDAG